MSGDDDPWRCRTCGENYVVQSLARHCEKKHEIRPPADEEKGGGS